jgi:hypothetical protein
MNTATGFSSAIGDDHLRDGLEQAPALGRARVGAGFRQIRESGVATRGGIGHLGEPLRINASERRRVEAPRSASTTAPNGAPAARVVSAPSSETRPASVTHRKKIAGDSRLSRAGSPSMTTMRLRPEQTSPNARLSRSQSISRPTSAPSNDGPRSSHVSLGRGDLAGAVARRSRAESSTSALSRRPSHLGGETRGVPRKVASAASGSTGRNWASIMAATGRRRAARATPTARIASVASRHACVASASR